MTGKADVAQGRGRPWWRQCQATERWHDDLLVSLFESSRSLPGWKRTRFLRQWLGLSAWSDQGEDEPGENGATQDATEGIHPTQHLVAGPQR